MSNQKDYKVDRLFLLIGENPLPNYVAAKTLLKDSGTIYLVHSTSTKSQADCLERMLKPINVSFISLGRKEANPIYIREKIREQVKDILKNQSQKQTFGLNYTGGTKAMAVHTYRELFDFQEFPDEPVFSYLDSRSLQMLIDQKNDPPKSVDEVQHLKLSLEEVFNLHDLRWKQEPINEPKLPEIAKELAKLHTDKNLVEAWHWWCENALHPVTRSSKKPNKQPEWKKDLDDVVVPLKPDFAVQELNKALIKSFQQTEDGFSILEDFQKDEFKKLKEICELCNALWIPKHLVYLEKVGNLLKRYLNTSTTELSLKQAANQGQFEESKHACQWLEGLWLEHYVLQELKELSKTHADLIYESKMSFKVQDPKKEKEKQDKFEFDVAFMRGYQIFAISCTTDATKSLCKQKLFEAYIRARQLGGDQARVALVCCYENPKYLENELKVETDIPREDPKVAVFGYKDLDNIQNKIKEWVDNNDHYYAP